MKLTQRFAAAALAGAAILNNAGCAWQPLAVAEAEKFGSSERCVSEFESLKLRLYGKGTPEQEYGTANGLMQMARIAANPEQQHEVIALCAKFAGEGLEPGVAKIVTEAREIAAGPTRVLRQEGDVFVP